MHTKHISTYILAAATSMLSLFAVLPSPAQSKKKIIEQQPDTIPFFRGMAVGVDLIGPVQLMVSDYGQYEASLRINLKDKYYPVFELGYGKADASDEATPSSPRTGWGLPIHMQKRSIYSSFMNFTHTGEPTSST